MGIRLLTNGAILIDLPVRTAVIEGGKLNTFSLMSAEPLLSAHGWEFSKELPGAYHFAHILEVLETDYPRYASYGFFEVFQEIRKALRDYMEGEENEFTN